MYNSQPQENTSTETARRLKEMHIHMDFFILLVDSIDFVNLLGGDSTQPPILPPTRKLHGECMFVGKIGFCSHKHGAIWLMVVRAVSSTL